MSCVKSGRLRVALQIRRSDGDGLCGNAACQ